MDHIKQTIIIQLSRRRIFLFSTICNLNGIRLRWGKISLYNNITHFYILKPFWLVIKYIINVVLLSNFYLNKNLVSMWFTFRIWCLNMTVIAKISGSAGISFPKGYHVDYKFETYIPCCVYYRGITWEYKVLKILLFAINEWIEMSNKCKLVTLTLLGALLLDA